MRAEEKQLIYFLNYVYDPSDVFIRADAVLRFRKAFLSYWKSEDEKRKSNYSQVIKEIYLTNINQSLKEAATICGLHIRTLRRYRERFIVKMKELMEDYQYISFNKSSAK